MPKRKTTYRAYASRGHVETWNRRGQPQPKRRVYRNIFGRFVSHHYVRHYTRKQAVERPSYERLLPSGDFLQVIGNTSQGEKRWILPKPSSLSSWDWRQRMGLAREYAPRREIQTVNSDDDMEPENIGGRWIGEPEVKSGR